MSSHFYAASLFMLLGGLVDVRAQSPISIPLHPYTVPDTGGQQEFAIYVGVNGGTPLPYLFDTGSAIFEAVINNAPFDPSTNSIGSGITTVATNFGYSYQTGNGFEGTLVQTSVSFYDSLSDTVPLWTISNAAGASNGLIVNAISNHMISNSVDTNYWSSSYWSAPASNTPPIYSNIVGTFGAGSFVDNKSWDFASSNWIAVTNATSTNVTFGSVLGQSTTSGYIVSVNSTNPTVTLGLNSQLRSQFTNIVSALGSTNPATAVFPGSGTTSFNQKEITLQETLSDTNNSDGTYKSTNFTVQALLDTGTGDYNTFLPANNTWLDTNNQHFVSGGNLFVGSTITTNGDTNQVFSIRTTAYGTGNLTDQLGSDEYTIGVGIFLTNSVMYDLQNTNIGFTTSAVSVVPEPSSFMLAGLGLLAVIAISWRFRLL